MNLAVKLGIEALEYAFLAGVAGTVLVLVLSTVEDIETIRGHRDHD